jgi:hypothetical protein
VVVERRRNLAQSATRVVSAHRFKESRKQQLTSSVKLRAPLQTCRSSPLARPL